MASPDQPIKTLLRDLIGDVGQLIRQELRLAQAEASQKLGDARHGATLIVVGGMLGFGALLVLLQALVVALANVVEPWLAAGIVAAVTAGIALILIKSGQSKLSATHLMPERTARSVRHDSELVTERVQ